MRRPPLPQADLDHFLEGTKPIATLLRGRRILLTGGTGFFGTWLLESFLSLNKCHSLGASIVTLSRSPGTFKDRSPHLAEDPALCILQGDIRTFQFPSGTFSHIVHAATDSVVAPESTPEDQYSVIVEGTRRVLDFAEAARAERLLFVSSGAVYGPQPYSVLHVHEDDPFQPANDPYTLGKRAAEWLCLERCSSAAKFSLAGLQSADSGLQCVLARCFAFLGPHLPLRAHFAAGNLLANALDGVDLEIRGDGTSLRSYLYAADLAVWLWTLLIRGEPGKAYNVGAERPVSIRELAEEILQNAAPGLSVHIRGNAPPPGTHPHRYVPSTQRAREELGVTPGIDLGEAILRTIAWHRVAREEILTVGNDLRE